MKTILVPLFTLGIGLLIGYSLRPTQVAEEPSPIVTQASMEYAMHQMAGSLTGKTGEDLEKAFLEEMIVHHQGAIVMANTLKAGTDRKELVDLANAIVTTQTEEISMMQTWLSQWFK